MSSTKKQARRLKVLVFTTLFPNSIQPQAGNFVLERLRHLREFADISVIAPVPYAPSWIGFNARWREWARVPRSEHVDGFCTQHPRYLVFPKIGMTTHGISMFAGTFRQVSRELASGDYDLIDAHYVYPDGFAATLLARILEKPVVVSARGSDINLFSEFPMIRPLIRQVLHRANGLIAVSNGLKNRMMELGCCNDNIAVVPNGVDSNKFMPREQTAARAKLKLPQDRSIVITVGRLDENKGIHILIDAVARLRSLRVMLLIAGEGPRRSHLEAQIQGHGLADDVKLVGTIPHNELSSWYSASDVFCLASLREGCPNVVLEAMACGRPVVATRAGGIPDLVVSPAFGSLVSRTPEAFESALREAFLRPWDRDAIAEHARSQRWENVSAQVMNVYSRAIGQFQGRG